MHKKKLNIQGSDALEFFSDFWGAFRVYYKETMEASSDKNWEKITELDTRRMERRQTTGILIKAVLFYHEVLSIRRHFTSTVIIKSFRNLV